MGTHRDGVLQGAAGRMHDDYVSAFQSIRLIRDLILNNDRSVDARLAVCNQAEAEFICEQEKILNDLRRDVKH